MAKFIIHGIAPIARPLIFCQTSPLQAKPHPFRTFHITSTNTGFIVEGEIDTAFLLVGSQVELWDKTGDYLCVQPLHIVEGEAFEVVPEVDTPLTHNIVRRYLLHLGVVGEASDDYIVSVGVAIHRYQQPEQNISG